jgi:NADH-ubiquinone oxidoreductase chain 6
MYSELIINSNYLVNINDVYTSGFSINFLEFLSILAIISSILVITNKNPILSVLFLISLFLTISIYLIMIGLNFIGISYLLVYIGAVSMLFLFILMLIDIRVSELHADNNNSLFLSFVIGILFYFITTSNTIINIYDMFLYNFLNSIDDSVFSIIPNN